MRLRRIFLVFVLLAIYGCSGALFQKPELVDMSREDPRAVKERFSKRIPEKFSLLNTIIFKYNLFNQISALGLITADNANEFRVVGLNPLGVKLFEISTDKSETYSHFTIEGLPGKKDFARVVGEDIKRIYFDLVPADDAPVKKRRYRITFIQDSGAGKLHYIFAGREGYLAEKKFYEKDSLLWKISYYEYRVVDDKLYPGGIVLDNYKYGYRLIVKLKEVFNEPD